MTVTRASKASVGQQAFPQTVFSVSGAAVSKASAQTGLPNAVPTKITFGTTLFDTGGYFDAANSRLVAPASGTYRVWGVARFDVDNASNTQDLLLRIHKNGAAYSNISRVGNTAASGGITSLNGSVTLQLNAGDYVELFGYVAGGTKRDVAGGADATATAFGIERLSSAGASSDPPTAKATRESSSQSIPHNTTTAVVWDTEKWDNDTIVDVGGASPSEFVTPTAGKYHISGGAEWVAGSSAGVRAIYLQVDTGGGWTTVASVQYDIDSVLGHSHVIAGDFALTANAKVRLAVFQNSGVAQSVGGNARTFLSLHRFAS